MDNKSHTPVRVFVCLCAITREPIIYQKRETGRESIKMIDEKKKNCIGTYTKYNKTKLLGSSIENHFQND